jgi:hypothetical protein
LAITLAAATLILTVMLARAQINRRVRELGV